MGHVQEQRGGGLLFSHRLGEVRYKVIQCRNVAGERDVAPDNEVLVKRKTYQFVRLIPGKRVGHGMPWILLYLFPQRYTTWN